MKTFIEETYVELEAIKEIRVSVTQHSAGHKPGSDGFRRWDESRQRLETLKETADTAEKQELFKTLLKSFNIKG